MNLFNNINKIPQIITNPAMYVNTCPAPNVSTLEATNPPIKFAAEDDNIHTAIKIEANFGGESFVTTDNPTGDKHNSPIVCNK